MNNILYQSALLAFRIYFRIFCNWQISGRSNVPSEGPLIVMANHISYLDPPLIGCILNRRVNFMAKEELFRNPIAGWALRKVGAFPVKRGRADRKAIKKAFSVLREEEVLGIFPEGTRHRPEKPGKAQSGAVMIVLKSRAPVLPVGIKFVGDKKVKASIGKPFQLDQYYDRKLSRDELGEAGELIMDNIKEIVSSL